MNIIAILLVGLISGWIASSLVEGQGLGTIMDIIVGVIGAFVGGFIFTILGISAYGFLGVLIMSVIGAATFLIALRALTGSRNSRGKL